MAVLRIVLLGAAVTGVLVRRPRWPVWAAPVLMLALGLVL